MKLETLPSGSEKILFENPVEANYFALWGIPNRHFLKRQFLYLQSLVVKDERRQPLSVTLPASSIEQSAQMLTIEAVRLGNVLNSNVEDKEIDANPETIAVIEELSSGIYQHLGKIAANV